MATRIEVTHLAVSNRWRVLAAALIVQVTVSVVILSFPTLVPYVRADLGLTRAQVGAFATIQGFGTMFTLLAAGWAVDAVGDRPVLVVGGVVTAAFTIVASAVPTFPILLAVLVLVGIGSATQTPAGSSAVMSAFGIRNRGLAMSIRQTGIPIGGAIAALALPPIAASNWRAALIVAALIALGGALIGYLLLKDLPTSTQVANLETRSTPLRQVVSRDTLLVGVAGIFLAFAQYALLTYIVLYVIELAQLPVAIGSLYLVAANLAGVVGRIGWGVVSDRVFGGRRKSTLILVCGSAAAACVVLALLPHGTPPLVLLLACFLFGLCAMGWNGIWVALLAELAKTSQRGRTVGFGLTVSQTGIVAGPFLFGLLVDVTHTYRLAWSSVAIAMLAAAFVIARVHEGASTQQPAANATC